MKIMVGLQRGSCWIIARIMGDSGDEDHGEIAERIMLYYSKDYGELR
jgi:hypothetical protein